MRTVRSTEAERWLASAHRTLSEAGVRIGAARGAVLEVLADEERCLLTPQQLIDLVRDRAAGSASSVYRALEEFERHGLVRRVVGPDGVAHVELEGRGGRHHHFVDDVTGEVVAFRDAQLDAAIEAVAARLGVELSGQEVLLRGAQPRADRRM